MKINRYSQTRRGVGPGTVPFAISRVVWLLLTIFSVVVLSSLLYGISTFTARSQPLALAAQQTSSSIPNPSSSSPFCNLPQLDAFATASPQNLEEGDGVGINYILNGLNNKPVDVVFLQDLSTKMRQGTKLADSKQAILDFMTHIAESDRLALVTFSRHSQTLQNLTADRQVISETVLGLTADPPVATQHLWAGLQGGYVALTNPDYYVPGTVRAMIMLSDGDASPETRDRAIVEAKRARDCGILIYTIGVGENANHQFLQQAADITDGEYFFTPDGADINTIYRHIAMELRNISITHVLPQDVEIDCALVANGWGCTKEPGNFTTLTYSMSNNRPVADPFIRSFTTTVDFTPAPNLQSPLPVSAPGSCIAYDGPGNPSCKEVAPLPVCVYRQDDYERYEPQDQWSFFVEPLPHGESRLRNFSARGDLDWIRVEIDPNAPSETVVFSTTALSPQLDNRQLDLFITGTGQLQLLTSGINQVVWSPSLPPPTPTPTSFDYAVYFPLSRSDSTPATPTPDKRPSAIENESDFYYLRVSSLDATAFGCDTMYEVWANSLP